MVSATLGIAACVAIAAQASGDPVRLNARRVAEIEASLPGAPGALCPPISDRAAWTGGEVKATLAGVVQRAQALMKQPAPDLPDDLYMDYFATGNRSRYQEVNNARLARIHAFALAEAAENNGAFIRPLEDALRLQCAQKSWVLPAHDYDHKTFDAKDMHIDLVSSDNGWILGAAVSMHEKRLDPEVVALVRREVDRRVVAPFLDAVRGRRPRYWWMNTTSNWNSVCLAGVTGAALTTSAGKKRRAEVVAAAEALTANFLKGFTPDGYCSEGVGYWNYGFGRFLLMAEHLRGATKGKVDLLGLEGAKAPAAYGRRILMAPGLAPAFSDCDLTAVPSTLITGRVSRRFGWGESSSTAKPGGGHLPEFLTFAFESTGRVRAAAPLPPEPRDWFKDAGVYIGRPGEGGRLSVALKGGHNDEHHNHNDVGSWIAAVDGRAVLLDPGRENYTARTFSNRRYESKLLNSYGHPVPVVAGQLQRTGRAAQGRLLDASFREASDSLSFDIRSCYEVDGLATLTRSFEYRRSGALSVRDEVAFGEPKTFETAFLTLGTAEAQSDGTITVKSAGKAVRVEVRTGGVPYELVFDQIVEDAPVKPRRIGIRLTQPVKAAQIELIVTPLP